MTPEELTAIIERDLEMHGQKLRWGGRPLQECLHYPVRALFADSLAGDEQMELWLVFEEMPAPQPGYKVVYSEQEGLFGLAMSRGERDVLIGFYGGFVETLNSME